MGSLFSMKTIPEVSVKNGMVLYFQQLSTTNLIYCQQKQTSVLTYLHFAK